MPNTVGLLKEGQKLDSDAEPYEKHEQVLNFQFVDCSESFNPPSIFCVH